MSWYWSKWWQFATSPCGEAHDWRRRGRREIFDADGRWVHLVGPIWY